MAQMVAPKQVHMSELPPSVCDRKSEHDGATRLMNPNVIEIKYNAEIKDPGMCFKCMGICGCFPLVGICAPACSFFDPERSYLYLREGSVESNNTINNYIGDCCGCPGDDFVQVKYFDRPPYAIAGCLCPTVPKLEIMDTSCYFCCYKCEGTKYVVNMPNETYCLCCSNRTNRCSGWCGLCGPIAGVPLFYSTFYPQPENPEAFVEMAKHVVPRAQHMD